MLPLGIDFLLVTIVIPSNNPRSAVRYSPIIMIRQVLLFYLSYFPFTCGQLSWEKLPVLVGSSRPPVRRDAGLGFDHSLNILVLFGGRSATKILNDTWIYNISTARWREVMGRTNPSGRFSFISGVSEGKFYVATGEGRDKIFYNDVWVFTMRTQLWEKLPGQPRPSFLSLSEWNGVSQFAYSPEARYGAAGGIFPGSPHLFVSMGFSERRYYDTAVYDVLQKSWHSEYPCYECNPYSLHYPHARCLHSGVMVNTDELVIFGGCLTGGGVAGPCPSGDSWVFDGKTKTWEKLDDCIMPSMYSALAMLPISTGERRVVLYGGVHQTPQVLETVPPKENEVGLLNPGSGLWTRRKTLASGASYPSKRASVAMVTGEDGVYMFGGFEIEGGALLDDLWLLRGNSLTADNAERMDCSTRFFSMIMVHGILMTIGWGVFLQWGAFVARYARHRKPFWFYFHTTVQILGLCCSVAGFVFAVLSVQFDHFQFTHGILGVVVMTLGVLQPISAVLRPHKMAHMVGRSAVRVVWQWFHYNNGRLALVLALINISLGLFLAVSHRVVWALWLTYLCLLCVIYCITEIIKRHLDRQKAKQLFVKGNTEEFDQTRVGNSNYRVQPMVEISRL